MQASKSGSFHVDVIFNEKSKDKHTFFVPGETVTGNAYFRFPQNTPFHSLHLEVVGTLSLKCLFNPDTTKKQKLPLADTLFEQTIRGMGFSYKSRNGDDKVRTLSVPFNFVIASDALPSFNWKSPDSKPDAVSGGSLSWELFWWMDVNGSGRTGPLPSPAQCSERLKITIVPQIISTTVSGPKGTQPAVPSTPSTSTVQHKKGIEVGLKLSEVAYVLPASLGVIVNIDNRTNKPVDGILFSIEETVTVKFCSKPQTFSRIVLKDRPNAPVFIDKQQQGVIKHDMQVSAPRGADSGVYNCSIDTPFITIAHKLCASPVTKTSKDIVCSVDLYLWGDLKEREQKEFKL